MSSRKHSSTLYRFKSVRVVNSTWLHQETVSQYNVFKLEIDYTYNVEKYLAVKNKEESFSFKWLAISNP